MNPHDLNDHRHLKPARLPIPPLLHFGGLSTDRPIIIAKISIGVNLFFHKFCADRVVGKTIQADFTVNVNFTGASPSRIHARWEGQLKFTPRRMAGEASIAEAHSESCRDRQADDISGLRHRPSPEMFGPSCDAAAISADRSSRTFIVRENASVKSPSTTAHS